MFVPAEGDNSIIGGMVPVSNAVELWNRAQSADLADKIALHNAAMPQNSPRRPLADFAVFAAPGVFLVLWSSGFLGSKLGMPYAEPMTFLTIRMAAVVVLLGVIVIVTGPQWPDRAGLWHSAVVGLLVHGCYLGGVFIAIADRMPAGIVALVVSLQPVLNSTLANRLLGERVTARQWLGLVLGIVGVYFVVHGRIEGEGTLLAWIAATVALVGITLGTLYQKRFGGGIEWRTGFLVQYTACTVLFGLAAFAFETRDVQWTAPFLVAVAYLVLVLSLGAIWLFYFLIQRTTTTRVVSLLYLMPPLTALMSWTMFGERLAPLALLGMAVCAAGVALVNWRTARG
jgi:drug/metabolite transporter (DMT)-like permease